MGTDDKRGHWAVEAFYWAKGRILLTLAVLAFFVPFFAVWAAMTGWPRN